MKDPAGPLEFIEENPDGKACRRRLRELRWSKEGFVGPHLCLVYESATGSELPIAETNWGCRVFGDITASG